MERTFISTGERIRSYLLVGLLLSLMLNALLTPFYPDLTSPHTFAKPEVISIVHPTIVQTPRPTPPPTPQPHTTQRHTQAQAPPILLHPPKTTATSGPAAPPYSAPPNAIPSGVPGGAGTLPTSDATAGAATVGPLCSNPNVDASVISAMSPYYPESARDLGLGEVTVRVQVTLDPQGRLVDAKIAQSSGNAAIDQSALRAARQTTYAPRIANCVPVEGTYIFRADFVPN